jgi:serine protease Do
LSGTRSKPNPEYRKINLDITKLNNFINSATQEYYRKQQIASQNCESFCNNPTNTGPCWQCSLAKTGAALRIGVIQDDINKAQNIISELQDQLLNIDQIIYEDVFSPYQYTLNNIEGVKESVYEVFLVKDDQFYKSNVKIKEKKIFQLPSNVDENDKNPQLLSRYDTIDDIKNWEITPMKQINSEKLFDEIDKNINDINEENFYAYFNINQQIENSEENENFFSKIFSAGKDRNKKFEKDKNTIIDNRFKSVVVIETLNSLGSGFFVKPNQVITNFHVVDGAKRITIKTFDGKRSSAKILKIDTRRDLALLETNFRGESVKFYKSEIYPGLEVEAIGHPNGLDYSLTKGVVSNIRDYSSTYNVTQNANTKFIQTDVAINPGNSGGPLFHKDFVIGVNTQGLTKSKFEGLNFSVHLDELLDFLS